jgi:methionyl aminopeptidase
MVIALEPIISATQTRVVEATDGWTLRTRNGSLAAHHEHTIVIRGEKAEVLTAA